MSVPFNNLPGNIRVPFFYAEFQSGGTPYQNNARLLLVGQKLAGGLATAAVPILVRDGQSAGLFGLNSMLDVMCRLARKNAPLQEIWALPLDDNGSGVKATGKISVSAPSLSYAQQLTVYIAGQRIQILVQTSDTRTAVAANLVAAINAVSGLPVVAAVDGTNAYEVDLTAQHKGTLGNAVDISTGDLNVDGPLGQSLLTITAMANGAGDPVLTTAFNNLGDQEFDWIASPYGDATSIGAATDLLGDVSGRWSWAKQIYGHYTCTNPGTLSALQTLGAALNSQHVSVFPCNKFRSGPHEVAAALGAVMAAHLQDAPELSRPLHTLVLLGIKGPWLAKDTFKLADRQTLYYTGISGYTIDRTGAVKIDRVTTTYRTNAWGDFDWTYLDVETMAQSMYGIRFIRTDLSSKFGRKALAATNPGRLPQVTTPKEIKAAIIHAYNKLVVDKGVFENAEAFAQGLVVEIDATDPNRVNAMLPLDHVNQLRIMATAAIDYMQLNLADVQAAQQAA